MSIRVLTQIWLCDLPPHELLVLQAIGDCADDDFLAHPSWSYLAWKTGLSVRTVSRFVKIFRDKCVLVPVQTMSSGVVVYRIELDVLPKKKPWRLVRKAERIDDEEAYVTVTRVSSRTPMSPEVISSDTVTCPPCQTEQRNKEEPSLNRHRNRGEQIAPETLAAKKVIDVLALTRTDAKLKTVEAAIVAESNYRGWSIQEAAESIAHNAISDRQRGVPIDRWYFEDSKWRSANGKRDKGSEYLERCEREGEILDQMLAGEAGV